MIVGKRVRALDSSNRTHEGVVMAVELAAHSHFHALILLDGGSLATLSLEGAKIIEHPPTPYVKPAPTSIPGPGEGR